MWQVSSFKSAAAFVGAVATVILGAQASASPGTGVSSQVLVTANLLDDYEANHDRIKLQTKDPVTVRVQAQIFAAGSRSGWHHHPGIVMVAVQSGSVTFTDASCGTKVYGPGMPDGSVFIEGREEPHEVSSASGATAYITVLSPGPVARAEDAVVSC